MNTTTRANPCPFCQNKAVRISDVNRTQFGTMRHVVSVMCPYCHARGPRTIYHEVREKDTAVAEAVARWNKVGE